MGAHFPVAELNNVIRFSTPSRMPGFLWHSFKWACWLSRFLQYMSGIDVLACSLDTDLDCDYYAPTAPFLEPLSFWVCSKRQILHNCSSALSWTSALSSKMHKFLKFLAEYLAVLVFLCCHYMFDSYITCLTLSFNTAYVYIHSC